jgi:hypothetical protein
MLRGSASRVADNGSSGAKRGVGDESLAPRRRQRDMEVGFMCERASGMEQVDLN